MKLAQISWIGILCLTGIYLFASAPPELEESQARALDARMLETENMLNAVNTINGVAREIYTARIVGAGKKAGLAFGEDWAEPGVEKGPLPALFLRLVSQQMERKPPQLGLYLGSDEPINKSNLFTGTQALAFEAVKSSGDSIFMENAPGGIVAMYPDFASAAPCVTCHNEHADSPKIDWKMDDVMGATTWTYPKDRVGAAEYLDVTEAFYAAIAEAYDIYLERAKGFSQEINIGPDWPSEGHLALPDAATFMAELRQQSAERVLSNLVLDAQDKFETLELTQ